MKCSKFFRMVKSQSTNNCFLADPGALSFNTCFKKPSKFGKKFWMLCEVKTSYVLRVMRYLGKKERSDDVCVLTLMDPYHKTGLNVTTENFLTYMKTAKKLVEHDITMVGTLPSNKKEIPKELLYDSSKLPIDSFSFCLVEMIK